VFFLIGVGFTGFSNLALIMGGIIWPRIFSGVSLAISSTSLVQTRLENQCYTASL